MSIFVKEIVLANKEFLKLTKCNLKKCKQNVAFLKTSIKDAEAIPNYDEDQIKRAKRGLKRYEKIVEQQEILVQCLEIK